MDTSNFNFVFLGQSVLKYQVPLDVYNIINTIYETKYPELKPANKQLIGKIEKEHSLFFDGPPNDKMTKHNLLPQNVFRWFYVFEHVLNICSKHISFNNIKCRNTCRMCFNNKKRLQTPLSVHSWAGFMLMLGSFFAVFCCSFFDAFFDRF